MLLWDRVNIVGKTAPHTVVDEEVPAQMGQGATSRTVDRGTVYIERAQVVFGPGVNFDPNEHAVAHEGRRYVADGEVLRRYRRGKLHHITVPLTRTS